MGRDSAPEPSPFGPFPALASNPLPHLWTPLQLEDRQTFLGLGTNRLVRWDMRDRAGVVQEMGSPVVQYAGGKDYARNTNFTCMATSGARSVFPSL